MQKGTKNFQFLPNDLRQRLTHSFDHVSWQWLMLPDTWNCYCFVRMLHKIKQKNASPMLVALLGIAQRQISIKFSQKKRKQNNAKPLPASIKTFGDLIQVKRIEKNLTPGHLAAKMGIAAIVVRSWEKGTIKPENRQLDVLVRLLGLDASRLPF